jgi:hypothetical protein
MDVCHESIATFGNCLDILALFVLSAQRAAQHPDGYGKVALFDKRVRPDLLHDLCSFDQMIASQDKKQEGIEGFACEGDMDAVPQ